MGTGDVGRNSHSPTDLTSPCRYNSRVNESSFNQTGLKFSARPTDMRCNDNITCCLPPPSPAPTCDRFIMSTPSPSNSDSSHLIDTQLSVRTVDSNQQQTIQRHTQHQSSGSKTSHKYLNDQTNNTLQRSISPNSRFRMSERFREMSPKCDRFLNTTQFLASNNPYTYLSSTVHTPVKRYVPTPPPSTELFSDICHHSTSTSSTSSNTTNSYHSTSKLPHLPDQQLQLQSLTQHSQSSQHHSNINTAPYRFRMKCCINDQAILSNLSSLSQNTQYNERFSSSPRTQNGVKHTANNDVISTDPSSSQRLFGNNYQPQLNTRNTPRNTACEYVCRTPSFEYVGGAHVGRVVTPVSILSEPSVETCLHCNTTRRTTGVHQTTQTTGPISPVPLQNLIESSEPPDSNMSNEHTSSTPTPSTSGSHISTLSPSLHQQQQSTQNQNDESMGVEEQIFTNSLINEHFHKQNQGQQEELQRYEVLHDQPRDILHDQQPHYLQQSNQYHQQMHQQPQQSRMLGSMQERGRQISTSGNMVVTAINFRQLQHRFSRKQRLNQYISKKVAKFFGVDSQSEDDERAKWSGRQRRFAIRRFGLLKTEMELSNGTRRRQHASLQPPTERPDILPIQTEALQLQSQLNAVDFTLGQHVERKAPVPTMILAGLSYVVQNLNKRYHRYQRQWSRSFAPAHITNVNGDNPSDVCEGLSTLQEEDVFFDWPGNDTNILNATSLRSTNTKIFEHHRQIYMGERVHGWRTSAIIGQQQQQHQVNNSSGAGNALTVQQQIGNRGTRISSQIIDGILENSRRPISHKVKLFSVQDLDDRNDHRPFFTYWINTVQILVLVLSLICYGIGPVGLGVEQKTGQVLVTSLSLQTVQHHEQRNVWIGPRSSDLVHMGAKFASCMRRDIKIMNVISKTRRQERETACCIRNDDSGCVQSSQADCSVRGLFPTKSISTWKKWSPGESGPGGRISGSVCGLDPKFCDAPASIAPYEWPDDITKWPICRKTNSFSQRFRFKDHTAEHMVCEVIGHPCCTGVFGECRITTREYCDFVNGYFHEEASLCSQISCLNNVCGMFPFLSIEIPDQFYRLFTSLCLHAGLLHLAITVAFQHIFLSDLERLIGPIRTAILYIGSGLAGNLTSAVLVPYKPEVGPLASLAGVIASLVVLLILIHWKELRKPHIALFKLIMIAALLFGIGTLPWQLNFAGLLAGILCGIILTIALVPFVSVNRYGRKTKINLIWTCLLFHLFVYTVMLVTFYLFPSEFTSLNFGKVISGNLNPNNGNIEGLHVIPSNVHRQSQQYHHHHHSDDIISNTIFSRLAKNDKPMYKLQFQQQSYYHQMLNTKYFNASAYNEAYQNSHKFETNSRGKIYCSNQQPHGNDTHKVQYQKMGQQLQLTRVDLSAVKQRKHLKDNSKTWNKSSSVYFNEASIKVDKLENIRLANMAPFNVANSTDIESVGTSRVSVSSPLSPISSTASIQGGTTTESTLTVKDTGGRHRNIVHT